MGEPIRVKEFLLDTREIVSDSNSESDEDKRNLIEDIQEQNHETYLAGLRRRAVSEDNIFVVQEKFMESKKPWYSKMWRLFYDNSFFNRLFPLIT